MGKTGMPNIINERKLIIVTFSRLAVRLFQFLFQFLDKFTTKKMWNSNSHNPHRQPKNLSSFPHEICSYCNIPISISEAEQCNHLMLCHQDLTTDALRCNKCKRKFPNQSALLNHLLFTRVS